MARAASGTQAPPLEVLTVVDGTQAKHPAEAFNASRL
jgi:hypothetical protein